MKESLTLAGAALFLCMRLIIRYDGVRESGAEALCAAAFVMRAERAGAPPWTPGMFERLLLAKERDKQAEAVTVTSP